MRLAIDVTAGVNQGGGVGRATRETVTALAALAEPPDLRLFYSREASALADEGEAWLADLRARHPGVRVRRLPLSPRWTTRLWLRLRLPVPADLVAGGADIVLAPDFVAPPTWRARTVVTIHDLSFLTHPHLADPGLRRYLTTAVPRAARQAAHVVAVSEATRRDVIQALAVPPERVSVVYNGLDGRFRPLAPATVAGARTRLGLPERFILTVGTLEPRKNHLTLLRAFARLGDVAPDLHLVIAGRRGWLYDETAAEVDRLGLGPRVRVLSPAPDADLPALYNAATAFAYPSWYEGFGLPPLEAMACGVPVVTSTASALAEVCGEAALLVEPADVAGLAEALRRLLQDATLRATLVQRGSARAARFSWAATARHLIEVLRRVR